MKNHGNQSKTMGNHETTLEKHPRVGNENQHLFTFLWRLINIITTSKSPANDFSCLYSSPPSPFHIPHIPEITHSVLKHQTLHQKCTVCSKSKHKMIYTSLEQYWLKHTFVCRKFRCTTYKGKTVFGGGGGGQYAQPLWAWPRAKRRCALPPLPLIPPFSPAAPFVSTLTNANT